ncbi:MAG: YncE family protein [Alphaproteobacteria bacterium]|nr:YncE family protein [Alphaproteobacteria bacterium]
MRKALPAVLLILMSQPAFADGPYRVLRSVRVGGDGGFDYVTADSAGRRLYFARSGKTNPRLLVFDLDSLKPVAELGDVNAHGAAVDAASHHGFASSKPITMFDSVTLKTLGTVAVDGNPDGLAADPAQGRIYVLSHSAPGITAIDAASGTVAGTLDLGAAPEQSAADGAGHLYVDLEDKDAVGVVDTKTLTVTARYPLPGLSTPAGLAMDTRSRVLFAACRNPPTLVMLNADTGAVLGSIPIGKGNDGVVFNPVTREVFASQGDGTLAIVKENSPTRFVLEQTLPTESGAKTLTLDTRTGHIFLIAADYGPVPADAPPLSNGRIARGPMLPDSFTILEVGR